MGMFFGGKEKQGEIIQKIKNKNQKKRKKTDQIAKQKPSRTLLLEHHENVTFNTF